MRASWPKIVNQSSAASWSVQHVLGGALEKMSIFALGIMPYVSSSIICSF